VPRNSSDRAALYEKSRSDWGGCYAMWKPQDL
jgi:hypothetical protein